MRTQWTPRLARRLRDLRGAAGWRLDDLADRSGISRATLSRLEQGQVSPTADQLNRLAAAHGLALSQLLAQVEHGPRALVPTGAQEAWSDPAQGIHRRALSPPGDGLRAEVIEVTLAPGTTVDYDRPRRPGLEHHLLMRAGGLTLTADGIRYDLNAGDSLRYCLTGASGFRADPQRGARYLMVIL